MVATPRRCSRRPQWSSRKRRARSGCAQSELVVADEMEKAAAVYRRDPIALRIRAMNMTYESIKERGALMVVPSEMPSSMGGLAAFAPAAFEPPAPRLASVAPDRTDA